METTQEAHVVPNGMQSVTSRFSKLPTELLDLIFQYLAAWELFPFLFSHSTHSSAKCALRAGLLDVKDVKGDYSLLGLPPIVQRFKGTGRPIHITLRGQHGNQKAESRNLTDVMLDGVSISLSRLSFDPSGMMSTENPRWLHNVLLSELCLSKQCLHHLARIFYRFYFPKLTALRIIFDDCEENCLWRSPKDCYSWLQLLLAQLAHSTPKLKMLHLRGSTQNFWPPSYLVVPIKHGLEGLEEISLPAGMMAGLKTGLKAGLKGGLFGSNGLRRCNFYCRVSQDLFNSLKELSLLRSEKRKKFRGSRSPLDRTGPSEKKVIAILLNKDYAMQGCHDAEGFSTVINMLLDTWTGVPGVSVTSLDGGWKSWDWKTVLTMEIEP